MADPAPRERKIRAAGQSSVALSSSNDATNIQYETLMGQLRAAGFGSAAMQTVGLTSSQPGEGVTTVACNLALYAASCQDMHVLLVDANFSRPGLDRIFQLPQSPGLTDCWSGDSDPEDCIHDMTVRPFKSWPAALRNSFRRGRRQARRSREPSPPPQLSVLSVGSQSNGKSDLVGSRERGIPGPICAEYDLVVVDLPPVSLIKNRWTSLANLDAVLFVVEAEQTSDFAAQKSLGELQQQGANVLGVALNRCRNRLPSWIDKKLGP